MQGDDALCVQISTCSEVSADQCQGTGINVSGDSYATYTREPQVLLPELGAFPASPTF